MGDNQLHQTRSTRAFAVSLVFFTSSISYLITPLLVIVLVDRNVSPAVSGGLIGLQLFVGRATTPLTGWLSDKFGAKWLVCIGILITALGHLGISTAQDIWALGALIAALGLGSALFGPSSKALAVGDVKNTAVRHRVFAWRNVAAHAGLAVGALVGTALYGTAGSTILLQVAGVAGLILSLGVAIWCPNRKASVSAVSFSRLFAAIHDPKLLRILGLASAYWAVYIQLSVGAPLTLGYYGQTQFLGIVVAINAIGVLVLQMPILKLLEKMNVDVRNSLVSGHVCLAVSLPFLGMIDEWPGAALVFTLLISLGVVLGAPSIDTWVTSRASSHDLGTYIGVSFLSVGVGSAVGGVVGGFVHDLATGSNNGAIVWACFSIVALLPLLLLRGTRDLPEGAMPKL